MQNTCMFVHRGFEGPAISTPSWHGSIESRIINSAYSTVRTIWSVSKMTSNNIAKKDTIQKSPERIKN